MELNVIDEWFIQEKGNKLNIDKILDLPEYGIVLVDFDEFKHLGYKFTINDLLIQIKHRVSEFAVSAEIYKNHHLDIDSIGDSIKTQNVVEKYVDCTIIFRRLTKARITNYNYTQFANEKIEEARKNLADKITKLSSKASETVKPISIPKTEKEKAENRKRLIDERNLQING